MARNTIALDGAELACQVVDVEPMAFMHVEDENTDFGRLAERGRSWRIFFRGVTLQWH